jgi:alginate O-acetyltransferase complex protein AlgI
MVFSDQAFLFLFLPAALAVCIALWRTRLGLTAVLITSLIFFYWESGWFTLLFIANVLLNFTGGILLETYRKRRLLIGLVAANLAILFFFKYAAFFLGSIGFVGDSRLGQLAGSIILPIGISFYTFQGLSYLIDVWRGDVAPERNIIRFGAYKSFFPVLIAGPIIRYRDVKADFVEPKVSVDHFAAGAARFVVGLGKKIIIADTVAAIAAVAFDPSLQSVTFATAWLGVLAYAVQLYFDFSGYSDMAIGLALMLGVRIPENFNHPYASSSLTEFWRRWHISLSQWFRDYVYVPLGGNRHGDATTYMNLLLVFAATGLWHGAAWTFVLWGLYHGALIVGERVVLGHRINQPSPLRRILYFFPAVLFGWAIFNAPDMDTATRLISAMFAPLADDAFTIRPEMRLALSPQAIAAFAIGLASLTMQGLLSPTGPAIEHVTSLRGKFARAALVGAGSFACALFVLPQNFSPFLYFRF